LESLAERVIERKRNLDDRMSKLQSFSANNELVNPDVESLSKISQIKKYEDQVTSEQQRIRAFEVTIANLNGRIEEAEFTSSPQRVNEQMASIRRRINSFNEQYITGGQTDAALLDSITTLRNKLDELGKRVDQAPRYTPAELKALRDRRDQAREDLQIARETLANLNRNLSAMRSNMGDYANKEATRKVLEEEVTLAREEYLDAQSRYAEAKDKAFANKLSIRQVAFGEPAAKPVIRGAVLLVSGSGVISFLLCAFVILAREASDSRIRTVQRLKAFSRINTIGIIPALPRSIKNPSWSFFMEGSMQSEEMSRLNDELRKIRYTLDSYDAQVFLITSTQKAQGKSFIVMALAYTLSLARKRTLIIDTNLRHNSLSRLLTSRVNLKQSIEYYQGTLRQLTAGNQQITVSDRKNLITQTHNEMVDIIGNKTSHLSPSEVIAGPEFKLLLNWLKTQYDYIFMEGASLNDYSDTRELAGFADKVIPVFSADTILSTEDKESLHFLRSLNNKLGCAILNRVVPEESSSMAAVY
jgi:Mrp family chromosome partitioning ATPase